MSTLSVLKNGLRFARDWAITLATYRRGISRTMNGQLVRVDWRTRFSFPPAYDSGATELLRASVKPGATCWNVGANVGVHAIQLARLVGPSGRVLALEPNPSAAALMARNIALSGFNDRVSIDRVAIGERAGNTSFYISGADPMGRPGRANPLLARTKEIQVTVRTLDELLAQDGAPDCLVVDIEGYEVGALLGAPSLLRLQPLPLMIFELHPNAWQWSGHSRTQLADVLRSNSLEIVPLSGQTNCLSELGQVLIRRAEAPNPSLQRMLPG